MGSPTPKLSLYSFPTRRKEPSRMITPPIHASVSIPFQWEEAPGKPKRPYRSSETETDTSSSRSMPNVARCLQLPPRLLAESKVASMPSPTTVLDRPDACRFGSNTLLFRKGESLRILDNKRMNKETFKLGSSRWGSFRKAGRVVQGSLDFSTPVADGGDAEVKITSVRKKESFLNLSQPRSNVLASIYESFKQVVPWRHGHGKMKKKSS